MSAKVLIPVLFLVAIGVSIIATAVLHIGSNPHF